MNAHRLYHAIRNTERALSHFRHVWEQQDGGFVRTLNDRQQRAELDHGIRQLEEALAAARETITSDTPVEPINEDGGDTKKPK